MNFAQLLATGPTLADVRRQKRDGRVKNGAKMDQEVLAQYRAASENGIAHSYMVAPKLGIAAKSAGSRLRRYKEAGLADVVGELFPGKYNTPLIYKWKDHCEN